MWTMLNNGVCPPEISIDVGFKQLSKGSSMCMALHTNGAIFTWGSGSYEYGGQEPIFITGGFNRHPAYVAGRLDHPVQVGLRTDWVAIDTSERGFIALDSEGYLWFWGQSFNGSGGWPQNSQYSLRSEGSSPQYVPGGNIAPGPIKLDGHQWTAFSSGFYHVIAQKADKSLWIWGDNTDHAYGTDTIFPGSFTHVPQLATWIPGIVRVFHCSHDVTIIATENNEIYVWGDFAWTGGAILEPTLEPLTIPSGVYVLDVRCESFGIMVLLSNGDVYVRGVNIGLVGPPDYESFSLIKVPGDRRYIRIDMYDITAGALDEDGNLWAWGDSQIISRDDTFCNQESYDIPVLVGSSLPGTYRWKDFRFGINTAIAIERSGNIYAWGSDLNSQLGVAGFIPEATCPALPSGPINREDGTLFVDIGGVGTAAIQIVIPSPKQLSEHNPCGHWHKDLDNATDPFALNIPECCWNFAVDISGNDVVLFGLGITIPWSIIALRYNISTRVWYGPYWRVDNIYTREWLAGASINGAFDGLMMYCGDVTGTILSATITEQRVTIRTTYHPTGEINERYFFNVPSQNCEGKIVVSATGIVAALIETGSSVQLWFSIDYGRTFILGEEWPHTGQYKYSRIVREGATYYVGIFYADGISNGQIKTYRSTNVADWTTCATVSVAISATKFNMLTSANNVYLLCYNQLFYSTDSAISFTSRSTTDIANLGAVNGADLAVLIFYTDRLEKTLDYTITDPIWDIYPIIPAIKYTLNNFTTVRSAGNNVIFMRDNLFVTDRIVLPVSQNLGESWELVPSPINYYVSPEVSFHGRDDPRWKFIPQRPKVLLDPQYK